MKYFLTGACVDTVSEAKGHCLLLCHHEVLGFCAQRLQWWCQSSSLWSLLGNTLNWVRVRVGEDGRATTSVSTEPQLVGLTMDSSHSDPQFSGRDCETSVWKALGWGSTWYVTNNLQTHLTIPQREDSWTKGFSSWNSVGSMEKARERG